MAKKHHHKKKRAPPPPPADDDDDLDAPVPPPVHAHRKASKHVVQAAIEAPADDLDDFKAPPPRRHKKIAPPPADDMDDDIAPMPAPRPKKSHHPVEDMVATAKGDFGEDFGSARKKKKQPMKDPFADDDDDAPVRPMKKKSPVPQGFEGGWRSLMKKKQAKKKHKFQDQTNGIMDLVQTPQTYQAWHPDSTDAVLKKSAKNELSAAEAAFDAPDGPSFLQLFSADQSATNDGSAAGVTQILLEQYAGTLGSATLLQLSRSELTLTALKNLWKQVSSVNASTAHSQHEAQSIKWCQDFQNTNRANENKRHATQRQDTAELAKTETQRLVFGQEAKAQKRFLKAVERDVQGLRDLLGTIEKQFDSTGAVMRKLQQDISRTAAVADTSLESKFFAIEKKLGKVEGLVSAGSDEITDIIKTAAARRQKSGGMWKAQLAQSEEAVADVHKQQAALTEERSEREEASDREGGLRDRYQQMCKWTLDDESARQRQEECEKTAIQAALIVLST